MNELMELLFNGIIEILIMLDEIFCVNGLNGCSDKNDNLKFIVNILSEEVKLVLFLNVCVNVVKVKKQKEKLEMKRECKVVRIFGIIIGVYIVCWFLFFIIVFLNLFF